MKLEKETLREATPADYRVWANGSMVTTLLEFPDGRAVRYWHREVDEGQVLEHNVDGKVYVLRKLSSTSAQLESVIDQPSAELLETFKRDIK